jgi:cyclic pyranopterin phosphate synthase
MMQVIDQYGRTFKTLRVSLLSACNLGCVYCTETDDLGKENKYHKNNSLSTEELAGIINQLHKELDLEVIRLTGGEPLLSPHLIPIIKEVKRLGIAKIKLTTNGFLLERLAKPLKDAGMQSINVSLDAVDEDVFFLMSRRNNVKRILNGIDSALDAGLEVKLNAVLMKGINEQQILPLLDYAFERKITIRFLEVMSMGHLHDKAEKYLVAKDKVLHTIAKHHDFVPLIRSASSTANYWKTDSGNVFGIIANESAPFCHDCNRLRLDSHGNIYGCLSSDRPIRIKDLGEKELREKLIEALSHKQSVKFTGSNLSMLNIGG